MAKIQGFRVWRRDKENENEVILNQSLWICGLIVVTRCFGMHDLPVLLCYTMAWLLVFWSLNVANIYAT